MRFLKTIEVCGQPYRIFRGSMKEMPDHEGWCLYVEKKIAIREDRKGRAFDGVLFHELLHAVVHESGCGGHFAEVTRLKGARLMKAEETFVQILSAGLPQALMSAGLLRRRRST